MKASGFTRVANDFYVEPEWLVDALLDVESFDCDVLDPACGSGTIPKRCRERGINAYGSDIADRGFGEIGDFFDRVVPVDNIICNPPFGVAQQFLEHALKLARRKVAIVQRLAFLEGQKRREFFKHTKLQRVWVSSRRASMPPGGLNIRASGGAIPYAWFVWDHESHATRPQLDWLP